MNRARTTHKSPQNDMIQHNNSRADNAAKPVLSLDWLGLRRLASTHGKPPTYPSAISGQPSIHESQHTHTHTPGVAFGHPSAHVSRTLQAYGAWVTWRLGALQIWSVESYMGEGR